MCPKDIPEVMAIEKSTASPWTDEQLKSEFNLVCGWQFVSRLLSTGEIVAFATGTLIEDEAEIRKLAVAPAHRRQGIGRFLLDRLVSSLKTKGATKCFLEFRHSNHAAGKLYQGLNFFEAGIRKNYYFQPKEDAILMTKILPTGDPILKTIKDIDITSKKILMRVDFNVPLDEHGEITDDTRIKGVLPTIEYARSKKASIVLISHCGRPKGQRQAKFSMAPAAKRLSQLIKQEVKIAPDCIGPETQGCVAKMAQGDIILLENLRFHEEETSNDPDFSRQLAEFGEIYINDAFAVSHRAHASVEGVTHHMKECGAGLLLKKEMDFFQRSVSQAERPLVAILGGAKVSSKLGAIRHLLDRVDKMIIGGAMANTFLKSQGVEIGNSLVEDDLLDAARELMTLAQEKGVTIHLPIDCVVAEKFSQDASNKITSTQDIPATWLILDIGPATSKLFTEALTGAKTIVWNGPMGAFEMDAFAQGSLAMAQALSDSSALTVVGGGDTNALINKACAQDNVSYMSTGGGAFLMLMEGKELPGVQALQP